MLSHHSSHLVAIAADPQDRIIPSNISSTLSPSYWSRLHPDRKNPGGRFIPCVDDGLVAIIIVAYAEDSVFIAAVFQHRSGTPLWNCAKQLILWRERGLAPGPDRRHVSGPSPAEMGALIRGLARFYDGGPFRC